MRAIAVSSNGLVVEGITFPIKITVPASAQPLVLLGNGLTDMTIETILVKFTAMAVYVDPDITKYLLEWKDKPLSKLVEEESSYFADFVDVPVQKLVKVGMIKGIRGSAYAGGLESSIRDRLANVDKYEEEEEEALEVLVKYLSSKNMPIGSAIFFYWPSPCILQVSVSADGSTPQELQQCTAANENVAKFVLHWIIGDNSVSTSTSLSTASGIIDKLLDCHA